MYKNLTRIIKQCKGQKFTVKEKLEQFWHDIWHYWWGFSHLRDWYYSLRNLIFKRYDLVRTGLPKTQYCDPQTLLLYSMMNIIVVMVEKEECFEVTDFYNNGAKWANAGDTIKEVYSWWKNYPEREKEIDRCLSNWSDSRFDKRKDLLSQLNDKSGETPQAQRYSKLHDELEKRLHKEEEEMMHKIVKIRDFLWT